MNTRSNNSYTHIEKGTIFVLILFLIPFAFLFIYVYPVYDDYWYADVLRIKGFQGAQAWWRANATGRGLTTTIISLAYYTVQSTMLHRLLLVSIFTIFIFSVAFLVKNIYKRCFIPSKTNESFFFFFLLFCFLFSLPGISQVIYWLSGAATYLVGLSLLNIILGLLIQSDKRIVYPKVFLVMALSLCACGTSELVGICLIPILFTASLCSQKNKDSFSRVIFRSPYFYTALIIAIFLYVVVLKATGNTIRMQLENALNPNAGNIEFALLSSITSTLKFMYNLFFVKRMALATLPVIAWVLMSDMAMIFIPRHLSVPKIILFSVIQIFLLIFTYFCLFTYTYSTGLSVPIQRVVSLIHFLWIFNIVFCSLIIGVLMKPMLMKVISRRAFFFIFVFFLFLTFLFSGTQNNSTRMIEDFTQGRLLKYSLYMKQQRFFFKNCKQEMVKKQSPPPQPLIYVWDLADEGYQTRYFQYYNNLLCSQSQ